MTTFLVIVLGCFFAQWGEGEAIVRILSCDSEVSIFWPFMYKTKRNQHCPGDEWMLDGCFIDLIVL